ncbi:MAG: hypothetical protein KKG59_00045 [Nanoarchaeota archaeon]|nr:hypothetical protein [Nanoarchaeota archaeon]
MSRLDDFEEAFERAIEDMSDYKIQKIRPHDHFRLIAKAIYKDSLDVYIKIPKGEHAESQCQMAYTIVRTVDDPTHLAKLIGSKPIMFGDSTGIVTKAADDTFENLIRAGECKEQLALEVIAGAGKGLRQMDIKGYQHNDIKPSNIFRYGNLWVIADFGSARLTKGMEHDTKSALNSLLFWSPELVECKLRGKKFQYSGPEDIYQLGVTLYQALICNPETSPLNRFSDEAAGGKADAYEFTRHVIGRMQAKNATKILLQRMLGPRPPAGIPPNQLKNFRYTDIDTLLKDLHGTSQPPPPAWTADYTALENVAERLLDKISTAEQYRTGRWGTIARPTVGEIVALHDRFLNSATNKSIRGRPETADLKSRVGEAYDTLQQKEIPILRSSMEEARESRENGLDWLNIIFLWGPPFTLASENRKEGKAKYTFKEQDEGRAHYQQEAWLKRQYDT